MQKTPLDIEQEVTRLYQAGEAGPDISVKLGLGTSTIHRILKRYGIQARPPIASKEKQRLFTDEQEAEIARRYASREKPSKLAEEFDTTESTIRKVVRRQGLAINPKGNQYREFTSEEVSEMQRRWEAGESQTVIAQAFQSSQVTISRVLRRAGITVVHRKPVGEAHGSWKGGRVVTSEGYIRVMVPSSDPLRCLADRQGYVLEHRLVMARHLGRPLLPSETVHHIDGDKTHNVPENLQLRQGPHGAGVCLRCLDCGSSNVETVQL